MTYLKLKYFVDIVDCGSISGAARKNIVAQQSMSSCLRALEKHYGVKLFLRTTPLQLTPEGQRLYSMAKKVLALMDEYEQSLHTSTRPLSIGLSLSGTPPFLSDVIETLNEKRKTPLELSIQLNCADRLPLPENVDLFFGMQPPEGCESFWLADDGYAVVVSRSLWARTFPALHGAVPPSVTPEAVQPLPFAALTPDSRTAPIYQALNVVSHSNNIDIISSQCCRGKYAAVIARDYAHRAFSGMEDMLQIPLDTGASGVSLYLYHQKSKPLSRDAKAFVAETKRYFAQEK